jgi:hypothetical protein
VRRKEERERERKEEEAREREKGKEEEARDRERHRFKESKYVGKKKYRKVQKNIERLRRRLTHTDVLVGQKVRPSE